MSQKSSVPQPANSVSQALMSDNWLKILRTTVGERRLDRLYAKDFRRWYKNWKKPANEGESERVRRAYGCVQALRVVLSYGVESGIEVCRRLRDGLAHMRFPKNPPREESMSFEQAKAIVEKALERREPSLALVQALQFECFLRRKDVIGEWLPKPANYVASPYDIARGDKIWRGLTFEQITLGADLRIRTSKTGQPVVHSIAECELVMLALAAIPESERAGPVAKTESARPWADGKKFAKAWREVATAAGVPQKVWNMDSRAGGISEARDAGASTDDIARQAGHADTSMIRKVYDRGGAAISQRVQAQRKSVRQSAKSA